MAYLIGNAMTGGYGGADILHECTIGVDKGEIAVIVGPNGAGKSTAMKAVFGMVGLRKGKVLLDGEDITSLSPQERVQKGMGFVPQTHNIFTGMTVEENLQMGAFIRHDEDKIQETLREVFELFPILWDKRWQAAGELSGGQRQQAGHHSPNQPREHNGQTQPTNIPSRSRINRLNQGDGRVKNKAKTPKARQAQSQQYWQTPRLF